MLTAQEIFDKVARHLLTQNARAMRAGTANCAYHAEDGSMCAVGCLISAENYKPGIEGNGVGNAWSEGVLPDVDFDQIYLLRDLQMVHDKRLVSTWPACLREVAQEYLLNTDVLQEFAQ